MHSLPLSVRRELIPRDHASDKKITEHAHGIRVWTTVKTLKKKPYERKRFDVRYDDTKNRIRARALQFPPPPSYYYYYYYSHCTLRNERERRELWCFASRDLLMTYQRCAVHVRNSY